MIIRLFLFGLTYFCLLDYWIILLQPAMLCQVVVFLAQTKFDNCSPIILPNCLGHPLFLLLFFLKKQKKYILTRIALILYVPIGDVMCLPLIRFPNRPFICTIYCLINSSMPLERPAPTANQVVQKVNIELHSSW